MVAAGDESTLVSYRCFSFSQLYAEFCHSCFRGLGRLVILVDVMLA